MSALLRHPVLIRAAQIAIGLLMAWAALAKLSDLPAFAQQIHNFRIYPFFEFGENLAAMVLPWIEILAALSLILGVRPRAGSVVSAALLGVFTLAVVAALARGLNVECGCFGTASGSRVGLAKVLENLGMLALALIGCQRACSEPPGERRAVASPREVSTES